MSAPLQGTSFDKSTKEGFHSFRSSIFFLIIIMQSSQGSFRSYWVDFYLAAKFQGAPPKPNPELNLKLDERKAHCVAVRKFSGFVSDDNIDEGMEARVKPLVKSTNSLHMHRKNWKFVSGHHLRKIRQIFF
ncbi:hypothetical protein ACJRO7_031377 [Eucalyptus globulus]|uniref:Uncharacterized protein n=1 Tax=Eucalyptus globulus TaxID=34317 RepID=A0ABD3JGE3_EUCGL